MIPSLETHDILLSDGTTTLGLVVVREKAGTPMFSRYYAPSLSPQQFTELSEAAFPPEQQAYTDEYACEGGFGKQDYMAFRYLEAFNTDASVKGLIYPSPVSVATTNSNPTQTGYNTGFESWTVLGTLTLLDNWARRLEGAAGSTELNYAKEVGVVQAGTCAVRNTAALHIDIQQTLGVVPVNGSIFTATMYGARTNAGNPASIIWTLYDASENVLATQTDDITAGANTFQQKTFTYTFVGTKPNPILRIQTGGTLNEVILDTLAIAWTGTAVTTLTMGTIVKLVDFNGSHYAISDTGVWKRTANNWVWVGGSPPGITDASDVGGTVLGGSHLALCKVSGLKYWLMRTNDSYVINRGTIGTGADALRWVTANSLNYTELNSTTVNKMLNVLDGGITTAYTIGQSGYNINSLVNHLESVYVGKENGTFYINSAGAVVEILPELRSEYNTNTGKNMISWWSKLYVPAGTQAMLEYDAGDVASVGPNHYGERLSDFNGQIVATASDGEWFYIVLDNGTKIEILKGRWETVDGATDFRWHPFFEDTYASVTYAQVSTLTAKRLWYGGGTDKPKYIPLPTKYGDPLNDTALTYQTGSTHRTPWLNYRVGNINKTLLSFLLHSTVLSVGHRTIKVEYQLWGESSTTWTEVGGLGNGTFSTSPTQEKVFATGVRTKKVRFQFTFSTDDPAIGLGMIAPFFTCSATINPPRNRMIKVLVRVADDNRLKNGNEDTEMNYRTVAAQLHAWNDTDELTLTIPNGTRTGLALPVKFDEGFPIEQAESFPGWEPPRAMASIFTLRFVEERITSYAGPVTPSAYRLPTGRAASRIVAPLAGLATSKEQADLVGDGTADAEAVNEAINAMP